MATRYASNYSYYSAASTAVKPYSMPAPQEQEWVEVKRGVRTKSKSKIHINGVLGVVFIVAIFVMIFRFTAMNELSTNNEALTSELKEASAMTDMARLSLDRTTDLNYVESVARTELGMDFPQNHQVVNVTLNYPDKAVVNETASESVWESIGNFFGGIWEYLA